MRTTKHIGARAARRGAMRAVILGAAALLLGACAMQDRSTDDPTKMAERLRGQWELVTLGGKRIEADTKKGERQPSMTITDDNTVRGWAGVNAYTGTLDAGALAEGRFEPGAFITTRRAGPQAMMDLEQRLLEALRDADAYAEGSGKLTLLRGEAELATFRRR